MSTILADVMGTPSIFPGHQISIHASVSYAGIRILPVGFHSLMGDGGRQEVPWS